MDILIHLTETEKISHSIKYFSAEGEKAVRTKPLYTQNRTSVLNAQDREAVI